MSVFIFLSLSVCVFVLTGSSDVEPPPECCFAAGKRKAICTITIVSDAIHELDEMFNIRLNPDPGQYICDAPRGPKIAVTIVAQGVWQCCASDHVTIQAHNLHIVCVQRVYRIL